MQKINSVKDVLTIHSNAVISISLNLEKEVITDDKDSIKIKNLVAEAKEASENSDLLSRDDRIAILDQLDQLENHTQDLINTDGSLVVYVTPSEIYYTHLAHSVENNVQVGGRADILPLVESSQYNRHFHVLLLNKDSIRLFENRGKSIAEVDIKENDTDAPVDQDQALGSEIEGGELNFGSAGPTAGGSGQNFHGHNEVSQEKEIDKKRYFQIVDDYIAKSYSNKTKTPLLLFGLKENTSTFREISKNDFLLKEELNESGADIHDDQIIEKIEDQAKELLENDHKTLIDRFNETTPEYLIEDIKEDLTISALEGQVEELIVEKGFEPTGYITDEGLFQEDESRTDFIYQLVESVIQADGNVYILDRTNIPVHHQMIARLRYTKD